MIGPAIDKKTGAPIALLAEDGADRLRFAGGPFITLDGRQREQFRERFAPLAANRPPLPGLGGREAQWVKPEMVVGVRHLRGPGALRHATVQILQDYAAIGAREPADAHDLRFVLARVGVAT
jgi:hypothetical protein